ncbi:MAG: glycosyltransferase [Flavobacteriales bacterium]|nr:glycosyltransferase [Flavobacteriales bacterium]
MNVLVISYWSFKEPLVQAAALPYLRMMRKSLGENGRLYFITLEKAHLKLTPEEDLQVREQLANEGIELITRNYHKFGLKAMLAWAANLMWILRFCRKQDIDILHAFGSPAATSAHVIHRLTKLPYVVDSYEPHAESMVENGSWKRNSIAYKLLWYFEKQLAKNAKAVLATTAGMKEYAARKYGAIPVNFLVRPACVSYTAFNPSNPYTLTRRELDIAEDDIVCVYAGKLGGIYLKTEVFELMEAASNKWGARFKFLLLSDTSMQEVERLATEAGFPLEQLILRFVPHQSVAAHLSLADFAINPVKPVPSKRYCTSIKDGEYWAMGLPVIIPAGISDDSELIERQQIGAVLTDLDQASYTRALATISNLLHEKEGLQERIRQVTRPIRGIAIAQSCYEELYGSAGALHLEIKNFLVLIYNSFKDPLFQNLVYEYMLHQAAQHTNYRFQLLTFEQKKYALSPAEKTEVTAELSGKGIYWQPLTYHSGKFMFVKKAVDFTAAFWQMVRISLKRRPKMIISFANTSAAISWVLSRFVRAKLMVYSYEPHSKFLAEFGIWKRSGWRYKLLRSLEKKTAKTADYILTGTKHMVEELAPIASGEVLRAPSSVDETVFTFDNNQRQSIRNELQLAGRNVLVYAGKFGGIYYDQEIITFCAEMLKADPSWYFIFLTPSDHEPLRTTMIANGLTSSDFFLHEANSPSEVASFLSASDVGLTAIPPFPSQRFRSPVKVGEYLMCGLPYITSKGVSEDDSIAELHDVGVVIPSLDKIEVQHTLGALDLYLNENREELRSRCRKAGISYRGRKQVDDLFSRILQEA